jgi:DNA-binding NtrC family response regulator
VEVDASALPTDLLDPELFGQEAGYGSSGKSGALETAAGGTIVIDEVAAVGPAGQARLLAAITRGLAVHGDGRPRVELTARIISATAHSLAGMAREGRFSPELFERLRAAQIELPPLRERRADIPFLAQQFAAQFGGLRAPRLSREAIAVLEDHDWPGNVRELRNVVERAAMAARDSEIQVKDLIFLVSQGSTAIGSPLRLSELERRHIHAVLRQTGWHQGRTAELLGISCKTLYRKIREYGFQRPTTG